MAPLDYSVVGILRHRAEHPIWTTAFPAFWCYNPLGFRPYGGRMPKRIKTPTLSRDGVWLPHGQAATEVGIVGFWCYNPIVA